MDKMFIALGCTAVVLLLIGGCAAKQMQNIQPPIPASSENSVNGDAASLPDIPEDLVGSSPDTGSMDGVDAPVAEVE